MITNDLVEELISKIDSVKTFITKREIINLCVIETARRVEKLINDRMKETIDIEKRNPCVHLEQQRIELIKLSQEIDREIIFKAMKE